MFTELIKVSDSPYDTLTYSPLNRIEIRRTVQIEEDQQIS